MPQGALTDAQEVLQGATNHVTCRSLVFGGARFSWLMELWIEPDRYDVGGPRSHGGSTASPRLELLDVIVGGLDLCRDRLDVRCRSSCKGD